MIYFGIYIFEKENIMGEEKKEIMEKKKEQKLQESISKDLSFPQIE